MTGFIGRGPVIFTGVFGCEVSVIGRFCMGEVGSFVHSFNGLVFLRHTQPVMIPKLQARKTDRHGCVG